MSLDEQIRGLEIYGGTVNSQFADEHIPLVIRSVNVDEGVSGS